MLRFLSPFTSRRVASSPAPVLPAHALGVEALESRTLLTVPAGFTETRIATNLAQPVQMEFAPDGRAFITEKTGKVRVMTADGQLLAQPFVTLTVDAQGERGALGVTFDPAFATNGFVYIYYTATTPTIHNRLSRFKAADANPDPAVYAPGNVVEPGSELPLMDFDTLSSIYHNSGSLHFGPDGKLYVAVGDNVRGVVAQQLTNTWGKILRINSDGSVPADNPFFGQTTGNNRAIWAIGLRNAFTFAFQPGTALMYLNEVGNYAFEEINAGRPGGNYGWPDTEGPTADPRFDGPIHAYANNKVCNAITGALFYNPTGGAAQFPSAYTGKYFFGDLCGGVDAGGTGGWIKTLDPVTKQVADFGSNIQRPVDFDIGPDGSLYYLSNSRPGVAGHVYRVAYAGASTDLNITVPPENVTASVGLPATFSVDAAGAGTITYQWRRNGVDIPGATSRTYTVPATALSDTGAVFRVVVSNGVQTLTSADAILTVVNNQPPVPTITLPVTGDTFFGGQTINFAGAANDPEDGPLPASAFTWRVDYVTGDIERQALPDTPGVTAGSFQAASQTPFTSTDVRYRVVLTVTDSGGLTGTTSVDLSPVVGTINLRTNPGGTGLRLTLDGTPIRSEAVVEGVVGVERVLVAPPSQNINGIAYTFAGWSDGVSGATRTVTTGAAPTTVTANYTAGPDGTGNPADADLTAVVTSPPVASLLTGAPARLTIRVSNAGGAAVAGPTAFQIVASSDAFFDGDDPVLATITKPLKLKPGKARNVKLNFTVPANIPQGSYQLLVRPDAAGVIAETIESNNFASTSSAITIAPAFSDLTGSIGAVRITGVGARRAAVAKLVLQNLGNAAYSGPVTVALFASTDATPDAGDAVLATLPGRVIKVKPNGRKVIGLRGSLSSLAAGTYYLVARISPSGAPADANVANNDVVSGGTFAV